LEHPTGPQSVNASVLIIIVDLSFFIDGSVRSLIRHWAFTLMDFSCLVLIVWYLNKAIG